MQIQIASKRNAGNSDTSSFSHKHMNNSLIKSPNVEQDTALPGNLFHLSIAHGNKKCLKILILIG